MIPRSLALFFLLLAACSPQAANWPVAQQAAAATNQVIPDFVSLVKREGATVVNVSTARTVRGLDIEPEIPGLSPDDPI
ncbi:MAG TPA: hypothetical protein VFB20_13155 [Burkholderiales bacterium]|nr:hypothetical protein [Burkholderiales bacterium]